MLQFPSPSSLITIDEVKLWNKTLKGMNLKKWKGDRKFLKSKTEAYELQDGVRLSN